ncbi:MAG: hypothetical protein VR70_11055 [Rhodospirillaceae bacterium BRH_c57]|nr:MAG: hypothetical protein VR70_11055 [Rhodospirillaceae bacterium BRH_c57]
MLAELMDAKAEVYRADAMALLRQRGYWMRQPSETVWGYEDDEVTVTLHTPFAGGASVQGGKRGPILTVRDHFGAIVLRFVLTSGLQSVSRIVILQAGPWSAALSRVLAGEVRRDHLRLARSACEAEWAKQWGDRVCFYEGVRIPQRIIWSHLGYLPLVLASLDGVELKLSPGEEEFLSGVRIRVCKITSGDAFRKSLSAVFSSFDVMRGEVWPDFRIGVARATKMLGTSKPFADLEFKIALAIPPL